MELPEGVTHRQVQSWISHGYIFDDGQIAPGRGHYRHWTKDAQRRVIAMGRLRAAGIAPEVAAEIARVLAREAEHPCPTALSRVSLDKGIDMMIDLLEIFTDIPIEG